MGSVPRTGIPGDKSPSSPAAIPAPESPFLSAFLVPESHSQFGFLNRPHPSIETAFGLKLLPLTGSPINGPRGYTKRNARNDVKEVSETRLASAAAGEAKRVSSGGGDMDIPEQSAGARKRATMEGVMDPDMPTQSSGRHAGWAIFTWLLLRKRKKWRNVTSGGILR